MADACFASALTFIVPISALHELFLDFSTILKKAPILIHTSWSRNLRLELFSSNEALLL